MTTPSDSQVLATTIRQRLGDLTQSERQAARALLSDYPLAGLQAITAFATQAQVSPATIQRLIGRLGYPRYADFQSKLRSELDERLKGPLVLERPAQDDGAAERPWLGFGAALTRQVEASLQDLVPSEVEAVATLLATDARRIVIAGGRFTRSAATYLCTHLQHMRGGVSEISGPNSIWADLLLDLGRRDLLVVFDVRRYQPDLYSLANAARNADLRIVLVTDPWMSPIAALAHHVLPVRVEAPSAWDTIVPAMVLTEALIAEAHARVPQGGRKRMSELERLRSDLATPDRTNQP